MPVKVKPVQHRTNPQNQNATVNSTYSQTLRLNVTISTAAMELTEVKLFFVPLAARIKEEVAGFAACAFWRR